MRNTRFLGTTAYTLFDEKGNEYIFEWNTEKNEFVHIHDKDRVLKESDDGVDLGMEFTDIDGNKVFVLFYDMETEVLD